jgi:hypothetical protein
LAHDVRHDIMVVPRTRARLCSPPFPRPCRVARRGGRVKGAAGIAQRRSRVGRGVPARGRP